jgi:PAS domain S-box-containing protein
MGERVTQAISSAAMLRARFLKATLRSGSPPSLSHNQPEKINGGVLPSWEQESAEVQQACLEQLVECAPEAITILGTDYRIIRVNSEFTRMFGYSAEEALGRGVGDLIVPPELRGQADEMSRMLDGGRKVSVETKWRRKEGSLVDVSILGTPITVGGEPVALYAIYRDISEQKRAEALNSALYRIAEKTSSAEDPIQFYAAIHSIVAELMYARNFYIALLDPVTGYLSFPYFVDEQDDTPQPRKMGRGLTEYVLRTGEPLLATPQAFEELMRRGEVEMIGAPSLDWLGVPLRIGLNSVGAVVVQSYTDKIRFGDKDKEILTFVSQQLTSAIEHKRCGIPKHATGLWWRAQFTASIVRIPRAGYEMRIQPSSRCWATSRLNRCWLSIRKEMFFCVRKNCFA